MPRLTATIFIDLYRRHRVWTAPCDSDGFRCIRGIKPLGFKFLPIGLIHAGYSGRRMNPIIIEGCLATRYRRDDYRVRAALQRR